MSKKVEAKDGDTLCGMAIAAGFLNCDPLRAEADNSGLLNRPLRTGDKVTVPDLRLKDDKKPTTKKHVFKKKSAPPVALRFVHGSPDKTKSSEDASLTVLNVSNFRTNRGGATGTHPFPSGFGFHPDGHADVDAFKVEVVDPAAGGAVNVLLEALRPVHHPDGTVDFKPIAGVPDAAMRRIPALPCRQMPGQSAFRSRYLRLVVDQQDHDAAAGQTLLTAEAVDAGDEKLEILEQHVRASYEFAKCAANPKCKATAELPIGEDRQRASVSVHILEDPATGTPVCTVDQARTKVLKYVRQMYAQASMSVSVVGKIHTVPAPRNLIAIADGNGAPANGGGHIRIRVRIGKPNQANFDFMETVQIITKAGDSPLDTATALASAINAKLAAATPPIGPLATPSGNPPLVGQAIGSADVLVGNPLTQRISLSVLASADAAHVATIGRFTDANINPDFDATNGHVGTILERTLVKNYDTGSSRIDLFVVNSLTEPDGSRDFGESFRPRASDPPNRQPSSIMVNTAIVFARTVTAANDHYTTIPHEMGHLLMDNEHARSATEMMFSGAPVGANERVVHGPKRISDPPPPHTMTFDSGFRGNPTTMLRTANPGIIDPF